MSFFDLRPLVFSFSRLNFSASPLFGLRCFANGAVGFSQSWQRFTFAAGEPLAELLTLRAVATSTLLYFATGAPLFTKMETCSTVLAI